MAYQKEKWVGEVSVSREDGKKGGDGSESILNVVNLLPASHFSD